ncbi:hypothetical protein [Niabella beijingensis]|uniref:hypothetical protein n=1 Tax=Niabella beijingensis TaxID=2872700 RepID=UPI001CBE85F9|nr:hypothetical protein [Niabella beijingensis]MBZ4188133.1 hypothetical protein [Niabella beijingensis]
MTTGKLEKKLRFLIIYVIAITAVCGFLAFTSFRRATLRQTTDELTVKRINIVDEDGALRMVVSNEHRQHPGRMNGQQLPARERPAGIIFFNEAGDECGGLVYNGNDKDAGLFLSVDKFGDDQVMQLQYSENPQKQRRKYGLQLWDYPKENTFDERLRRFKALKQLPTREEQDKAYEQMLKDSLLMQDRLFIGQTYEKEMGLFIKDQDGKPRIKIFIDKDKQPRIQVLNPDGTIMR